MHAVEQDARDRAARSITHEKRELATKLRLEYMRPVERFAESIFPNDAALRAALSTTRQFDYAGLVSTALGMADFVSQNEAVFTSAGFNADFVTRLRQAAGGVSAAIVARSREVAARASSAAGQLQEVRRGRDVVRLIDAMIVPGLAGHSEQLAEWRSISRFVRRAAPRVAPGDEGTATTTPEVPAKAA